MPRIQKPSGRRYAKGDLPLLRVDGQRTKVIKHGAFRRSGYHPLALRWHAMISRCTNPRVWNYADYGGRGITVCDRWRNIANFIEDMGPDFKPGLYLDRIDNNGNYEPSNCRWATAIESANNARSNRKLSFNGKVQNVAQWARELGVKARLLRVRLLRGWSVEETLSMPNYGRCSHVRNKQV